MNWDEIPQRISEPDFDDLLTVLKRGIPQKPVLFEFYFNDPLYSRVVPGPEPDNEIQKYRRIIKTFYRLGYDYATLMIPDFRFTDLEKHEHKESLSLNEGAVIFDNKDLDRFEFPDPEKADYSILDQLSGDIPEGMKLILYSHYGVLENVIRLMGFDELCYRLYDNTQLVESVFEEVGSRLVEYYKIVVRYDCVGAAIANDDWGFNSSTFFSPEVMRRYVFPWYKQIVEIFHDAGKPVILHSCGYFENIIEDIVEDIKFDARHSYEDNIIPVEDAYEKYNGRIAVIGGIDIDFICSSTPRAVYDRSMSMLERTADRGGYALGTGNSVPEYIPDENFYALIYAAVNFK
ncbi:MAG: hypothetical protein GY863_11105 [bacterium]|nr:hypothetical protein [bacterium]